MTDRVQELRERLETMASRLEREAEMEDNEWPEPDELCGASGGDFSREIAKLLRDASSCLVPRTPMDIGPYRDCPRCHGSGEESNAQFRCSCRWADSPLRELVPRTPAKELAEPSMGDDASREAAKRMSVRGPSPTPHRVRPPGSPVTLAEYNMALAEVDDLRQALVALERHHCSGCGHLWEGRLTGVELCGDCWRRVQSVAQEASSEAPQAELLAAAKEVAGFAVSWEPLTPSDIARLRAAIAKVEASPTVDREASSSVTGRIEYDTCEHCHVMRPCGIHDRPSGDTGSAPQTAKESR